MHSLQCYGRVGETGPMPFWYARVLGVFHIQVLHTGPAVTGQSVQHLEFLWVDGLVQ